MNFIRQIFTWWNGQTLGTRFYTWRKGVAVGDDQAGNKYYRDKSGVRRWVIYNGLAEPSCVPPDWHGWLHHKVDNPPDETYRPFSWQKAHKPNLTGTPGAYRPEGSLRVSGTRDKDASDYDAWSPE